MIERTSSIFKELTLRDARYALETELDALVGTIPTSDNEKKESFIQEMNAFKDLFARYLYLTSATYDWKKVEPISSDSVKAYDKLIVATDRIKIREQLNKLVVVKLNGGLGTSMGCVGPKSLIAVRNDITFLDLTIQQIENLNNAYGASIPLILMNSFNTHEETMTVLRKYQQVNVEILTILQSAFPRLNRESLLPIAKCACSKNQKGEDAVDYNQDEWYPPGHGDFYGSFVASGLAKKMMELGKEWVFLSNIDNLGATIDLNILNFVMDPSIHADNQRPEFVMEVTDKTKADVKGGTLINYGGNLGLLELAQVPADHVDEFASVRTFRIFNTNNLWIDLNALYQSVTNKTLQMDVIVNHKTLDNGMNIIQLEEAAGAAIKSFKNAFGVNVARNRFLPVKTTSDLLLIMSNLYELESGCLKISPLRSFPTVPLIKLGSHFKKVKDFLARFASIPDLLELDHLTLTGDVYFGKGITLKGTVIIIANFGNIIHLPAGSQLENKIVSGNLCILDH